MTTVGPELAVEIAQAFLGDLGLIATSDRRDMLETDECFILRFATAAGALDDDIVLVVDRATGDASYRTLDPSEPWPWPEAKPVKG